MIQSNQKDNEKRRPSGAAHGKELTYMKKYDVESGTSYYEELDNYYGDYIEAETAEEALDLYQTWLQENGEDPDNFVYRVFELIKNDCGEEERIEREF